VEISKHNSISHIFNKNCIVYNGLYTHSELKNTKISISVAGSCSAQLHSNISRVLRQSIGIHVCAHYVNFAGEELMSARQQGNYRITHRHQTSHLTAVSRNISCSFVAFVRESHGTSFLVESSWTRRYARFDCNMSATSS